MESPLGRIIWQPQGTQLSQLECDWLQHPASAGIILFDNNYEDPAQLKALTDRVQQIAPHAIISIDHEGGRVQRLQQGFTSMPPAALIGELYQQDTPKGLEMATLSGRLAGYELRKHGINLNYAPVLDINRGLSQIIGDRSWGATSSQIIALTSAYVKGLHQSGVASVGKHFPGHGGVQPDSHISLPIDKRPAETIIKEDLQPFIALAPQLPAIMTAHIVYQTLDSLPATFSRFWLEDQLRNQMNYKGVIFSDDLNMGAVKELYADIEEILAQAFSAGCDLALVGGDAKTIARSLIFCEQAELPPPISLRLPAEAKDGFDEQAARDKINTLNVG